MNFELTSQREAGHIPRKTKTDERTSSQIIQSKPKRCCYLGYMHVSTLPFLVLPPNLWHLLVDLIGLPVHQLYEEAILGKEAY